MEKGATFFGTVMKTPYNSDQLLELLAAKRKYVTNTTNLELVISKFTPVGISRIA